MSDQELRDLLMSKVSSAIRNSGDDRWIAEKVNYKIRSYGLGQPVEVEQVERVMAALTYEEKRRPLDFSRGFCAREGKKPDV